MFTMWVREGWLLYPFLGGICKQLIFVTWLIEYRCRMVDSLPQSIDNITLQERDWERSVCIPVRLYYLYAQS